MALSDGEIALETRVLIADRHTLFRHGLIGLLRDARPEWDCEEADSFDRLQVRIHYANVVLIDLSLPALGGLEGLSRLCGPSSRQSFVALSDDDDRGTILGCLAAGAHGYMLKSASPSQFIRALDTVLDGGIYAPASPNVAMPKNVMATTLGRTDLSEPKPGPNMQHLTGRQQEVFRLLAEGCATKTIARRLDMGVGTVKVHLAAIYRSLGAHSRLEAVAKAHRAYAMG